MRYVIDFHSIGHVSHSAARALELVSDKCYFVPALYQALAKLVSVCLYATEFGEGEVCADKYAIFLVIVFNSGISVKNLVCFTLC